MREPDLQGPVGKAWLLKRKDLAVPDHDACLASWLVYRPGAHPWWAWWIVSTIHLRDAPGMEPANKSYPEAEYECLIVAIDPDRCPKPDPDSEEGYPYLIPMDIEEQFHGISDADASRIGELVVRTILSGGLSPDEEQAAYWHRQIQSWVYKIASGKMAMN